MPQSLIQNEAPSIEMFNLEMFYIKQVNFKGSNEVVFYDYMNPKYVFDGSQYTAGIFKVYPKKTALC